MELLGTKSLQSSTGDVFFWADFDTGVSPDPVCVVVAFAIGLEVPMGETLSIETYAAGIGETSYGDAVTGTVSTASSPVSVQSLPTLQTNSGDGNGWKVTASTAGTINVELYLIAGSTADDLVP